MRFRLILTGALALLLLAGGAATAQERGLLPKLGLPKLFGDKEMIPARGQLVVLLPQPEVTYNLLSNWSYMFPRRDGIILGGTFERGNWSTDEDPATTAKILANHKAMFAKLKA